MQNALYVIAPLLVSLVLVTSAVGKLRAPERARAAFSAMGVPKSIDRPWVARVHPWAEIILGMLLVLVPGTVGVVVAAVALLLMIMYLVLVIRAVRSPDAIDCACFGSLGGDHVTWTTVWRNVWLIVLAATAVWCSLEGRSVASRLRGLTGTEWSWLVAVAAAVVTVALIVGARSTPETEPAAAYLEEDDYVRSRTPALPVVLGDGSRTDLRTLSSQRAQLLVFVSEGCGSCVDIIAAVPRWRDEIPQVDVRVVVAMTRQTSGLTSSSEPTSIHDPDLLLRDTFGIQGNPSALLLGADGLLAGGPVAGGSAVSEFVNEIRLELEEAQTAQAAR